ncbi:MAG: response regulator [Planctomycetes bacterium]|nr:response regulator [Planctomycetota bacterium]
MTQQHKALIVDDQQGVLEILGAILSSLDHAYDYARTQREARDLLIANRYCYILLDLEFPADEGITARIQTGFNCLAEIRQRFHRDDLPVIVMTAHENGTAYPIRALQLGANDFAQKDFDDDLEPLDVKIGRVIGQACDAAGRCRPLQEGRGPRRSVTRQTWRSRNGPLLPLSWREPPSAISNGDQRQPRVGLPLDLFDAVEARQQGIKGWGWVDRWPGTQRRELPQRRGPNEEGHPAGGWHRSAIHRERRAGQLSRCSPSRQLFP